jgi:TorA maturation chaperone TorD
MDMQEGALEQTIQAAGSTPARRAGRASVPAPARTSDQPDAEFMTEAPEPQRTIDEIDRLRAQEYDLLALLLGRAPTPDVLDRLRELKGDASPLGLAHLALADAASAADPDAVQREFFDLFIGLGRGELLPYASYYLTGFLHERPLVAVRGDLRILGIERAEHLHEPEDHIAILCEVMAGLAAGRFDADEDAELRFFERHLRPWAPRFFTSLETANGARFYRAVARVGGLFMDIEAEAFAMDA